MKVFNKSSQTSLNFSSGMSAFVKRLLGLSFLLSLALSQAARAGPQVADWNVLFYLNGKNNLQHEMQEYVLKNLHAMSDVNGGRNIPLRLPPKVNILVEYGTMTRDCDPQNRVDHDLDLCRTGVKRFRMIKGLDQVRERDSAFQNLGKVDMGNVDSLVDFAAWSRKFPAKRTVLYVFNHGTNFDTSEEGLFSFDDESGNSMSPREIAVGFRKMAAVLGRPIDLFMTDMCLVGSVEALGQMDGALKFYVASRDNVQGYSVSVIDILRVLERLPGVNAKRWAYQIVQLGNRAGNVNNFSAFSLAGLRNFEISLSEMIKAILRQPIADRLRFKEHFLTQCRFPEIEAWSSFEFRDVLRCLHRMPGMDAWPEYRRLHEDFFRMMFTNSSEMMRSGLSIWAGQNRRISSNAAGLADYRTLRFDQVAHWSDLIEFMSDDRN